jgi:hypothetical protein
MTGIVRKGKSRFTNNTKNAIIKTDFNDTLTAV